MQFWLGHAPESLFIFLSVSMAPHRTHSFYFYPPLKLWMANKNGLSLNENCSMCDGTKKFRPFTLAQWSELCHIYSSFLNFPQLDATKLISWNFSKSMRSNHFQSDIVNVWTKVSKFFKFFFRKSWNLRVYKWLHFRTKSAISQIRFIYFLFLIHNKIT